jgi:hypothetical protein
MKNKETVKSPSHKENKEEFIQSLEDKEKALADALYKTSKELNGEKHFDTTLPKYAKKLGVSEDTLKRAYQKDKGELVEKFNRRQHIVSEAIVPHSITTMATGASGMFGYMSYDYSDPFTWTITGIFSGLSVIAATALKAEFKKKSSIDKDIKLKALEYKKSSRLPEPSKR